MQYRSRAPRVHRARPAGGGGEAAWPGGRAATTFRPPAAERSARGAHHRPVPRLPARHARCRRTLASGDRGERGGPGRRRTRGVHRAGALSGGGRSARLRPVLTLRMDGRAAAAVWAAVTEAARTAGTTADPSGHPRADGGPPPSPLRYPRGTAAQAAVAPQRPPRVWRAATEGLGCAHGDESAAAPRRSRRGGLRHAARAGPHRRRASGR